MGARWSCRSSRHAGRGSTCMVFFQAVLLGGYAYAHARTAWLGIRARCSCTSPCSSCAWVLPLREPAYLYSGGQGGGTNPVLECFSCSRSRFGLPFLVVSAPPADSRRGSKALITRRRAIHIFSTPRAISAACSPSWAIGLHRALSPPQGRRLADADAPLDARLSDTRRPDRPLRDSALAARRQVPSQRSAPSKRGAPSE